MSRPDGLDVWRLAEGDWLPNRTRVVSIHRDPANERVTIGTDDGVQRSVHRDDRLIVGPTANPGTRVGRLLHAGQLGDSQTEAPNLAVALSRLAGPDDIDDLLRHETTWIAET